MHKTYATSVWLKEKIEIKKHEMLADYELCVLNKFSGIIALVMIGNLRTHISTLEQFTKN